MRTSEIERNTYETKIKVKLNIDGEGKSNIKTNIGFFDHMLHALAKHSNFNIDLTCDGDLYVDTHHTVEDCGIVLGEALTKALGDKPINRYYSFTMPMDDALVLCSIDISGRSYYNQDYKFTREKVGELETECVSEFFLSFTRSAKMNLHFVILRGENNHHIIEAMFKSLAVCLKNACKLSDKLLSTKGVL